MSGEELNFERKDWPLAELLASPELMSTLWFVYEGFGRRSSHLKVLRENVFPRESVIQELLEKGFLEQSGSQLALSDLGRQALSCIVHESGVNNKTGQGAGSAQPSPGDKTILIKQIRSAIGHQKSQREVLRGLGLRHINQIVERQNTPEVRGMINRIPHLVQVLSKKKR